MNRIALSALCLLALFAACQLDTAGTPSSATAVDAPNGIGTSPSACVGACDPEGIGAATARSAPDPSVAPPSCGVWLRESSEGADAVALACVPPDAAFHVAGHLTCSDALAFAGLHASTAVVRRLTYQGVAIAADCP